MPNNPPNDNVEGITLRLTEQDIRYACEKTEVPFAGLVAIWRRFRTQDEGIQMADVLYVMALAKSKNLNPLDNNYSLIPRPGNKGFSLTFNKEAALAVITSHPRVKPGTMKRWFVTGKGDILPWSKSPSWRTLAEIDWDLEAHVTVEDEDGQMLPGEAKYGNAFAAGQDRNPKYLWLKDAGGMLMKQAYKDLANTQFGGGLPDEEEAIEAQRIDEAPARSLPAASEPRTVETTGAPAPEPVEIQPPQDRAFLDRIAMKAVEMGSDRGAIWAAWGEQEARGITAEAFEASLDAEIEKRKPKQATRAPRKPKAPPKPVVTIVGEVEAIAEKMKAGTQQPFLVIRVNSMDLYVWDRKLHDLCRDAYQNGGEVKVSYVIAVREGDPTTEFADVTEIERVEAKAAEPPEPPEKPPVAPPVAPEQPKEKPKAAPKDDGPPPLFSW